MKIDEAVERAKFEAHIDTWPIEGVNGMDRWPDGRYHHAALQKAWNVWKAALAAMPERDGEAAIVTVEDDDGFERIVHMEHSLPVGTHRLYTTPPAPVRDGDEGWLAMTCEARRMQHRHLDNHQGDVYHAMQALVTSGNIDRKHSWAAYQLHELSYVWDEHDYVWRLSVDKPLT